MPIPPITDSDWVTSELDGGLNIDTVSGLPAREVFPQDWNTNFSTYSLRLDDLYRWMQQTTILSLIRFPPAESYRNFDPFRSSIFRGTTDYSDAPETAPPDDAPYLEKWAWDNLSTRHIITTSDLSILSDELQATRTTIKNPSIKIRYGKTDLIRLQDQFNQEQESEWLQRRPENFIGKSLMQAYVAWDWFIGNVRENGYEWPKQKEIVADYNYPSSLKGGVSSEPGPYYIKDRYFLLLEWLVRELPKLQVSNLYHITTEFEGEALLPEEIDRFFDAPTFSELIGEEPFFNDDEREEDEDLDDFQIRMLENYDWGSERENHPFGLNVANLIEYYDTLRRFRETETSRFISPTTQQVLSDAAPKTVTDMPDRLISQAFIPALIARDKLTNQATNSQGATYISPEVWLLNNNDAYLHYFTDTYSWRRGAFEWTETFDGTANEAYPVLMLNLDDPGSPIFLNYRYRFSFQYSGAKMLPINYSAKAPNFWRILSRN